jgi:hypothetical protein
MKEGKLYVRKNTPVREEENSSEQQQQQQEEGDQQEKSSESNITENNIDVHRGEIPDIQTTEEIDTFLSTNHLELAGKKEQEI